MGFLDRLQDKWNLQSKYDLWIILLVFALTGTTIVFLKRPVIAFFANGEEPSLVFSITYYVLILPIYNVILLVYGFIFRKFSFFWEFEKKMFRRFRKKKADSNH